MGSNSGDRRDVKGSAWRGEGMGLVQECGDRPEALGTGGGGKMEYAEAEAHTVRSLWVAGAQGCSGESGEQRGDMLDHSPVSTERKCF